MGGVVLVFLLMGIGCFLAGTNDFLKAIFSKRGQKENLSPPVIVAGTFLSAAFVLGLIWFVEFNQGLISLPKPEFWSAVLITSVLNVIMNLLIFTAYTKADVTLLQPLWALPPMFMVVSSWLILGETPKLFGLIGIFSAIVGIYILNTKGKWSPANFWAPFVNIWKNAGTRLYFLAMIPPVISIVFDKKAVLASDPITMSVVTTTIVGSLALGYNIFNRKGIKISTSWIAAFLIMGALYAVTVLSYNTAIGMALVAYIGALKRFSIIVTVFLAYIFLKERAESKKRLLSAAILTAGAILIGISL